jgi:phage/conjugal plasmid C-4 type zinc finger TraR family protein
VTECSDPIDRASKTEADFRSDALREQARRAGLEGMTVNDSAECCRVCGEPIPQGRREAYPGTQLCVACQADIERALS